MSTRCYRPWQGHFQQIQTIERSLTKSIKTFSGEINFQGPIKSTTTRAATTTTTTATSSSRNNCNDVNSCNSNIVIDSDNNKGKTKLTKNSFADTRGHQVWMFFLQNWFHEHVFWPKSLMIFEMTKKLIFVFDLELVWGFYLKKQFSFFAPDWFLLSPQAAKLQLILVLRHILELQVPSSPTSL